MHAFPGDRVEKFQYPCMKGKTVERIRCRAIFLITGDTVSKVLKMDPYLIFPARLQGNFKQAVSRASFQDTVPRHRFLSIPGDGR